MKNKVAKDIRHSVKAALFATLFFSAGAFNQAIANPEITVEVAPEKGIAVENHCSEVSTKRRPKIGLALGGGGMRGAAHVGVLKVLEREGIPIDYIAGTSMGSVVGGLYASGVPLCDLEEKFIRGRLMKHFMTVPVSVRLAIAPLFFSTKFVGGHSYDGLYRGNIFRKYMNKSVIQDDKSVETFKTPFCAIAMNLIDGKPYALSKGNLGRILQASCALPILRRPVRIDDKLFVDGGVLVNLPTEQVRAMGADIVIAVDVDEKLETVPMREFEKLGSVAHRVITLHLSKIDEELVKQANVVIMPSVNGISMVSTHRKDAKTAIAAGEDACSKMLPDIRKLLGEDNLMVGDSKCRIKEPEIHVD